MKWIFRPRGLRPQLMLAFFMLGLVPFLVVTLFFLYSHGKDLTTQTSNHLVSVRNIKKSQLEDYFGNLKEQIINFSQQDFAGNSIGRFYGFTGAFEKLGTTPQEARARAQPAIERVRPMAPSQVNENWQPVGRSDPGNTTPQTVLAKAGWRARLSTTWITARCPGSLDPASARAASARPISGAEAGRRKIRKPRPISTVAPGARLQ